MDNIENEVLVALDKAMPAIARRIENELVINCPVDMGRLRASIKVRVVDNKLLISMAEYGRYVIFGTPPHTIRPKEKQALSFPIGNNKVITKKVEHPGTRPNPFVQNVLYNKLGKIIVEEINNNL